MYLAVLVILLGAPIWKKITSEKKIIYAIVGFVLGGGFYIVYVADRIILKGMSFSLSNIPLISENSLNSLFTNATTIFWGFILHSNAGYFFPLALPALIIFFFIRKNDNETHLLRVAMLTLLFLIALGLTNASNARADGFPRFLLPVLGLACVFFGNELQRFTHFFNQKKNAEIVRAAVGVFVLVWIGFALLHVGDYIILKERGNLNEDVTYSAARAFIPNTGDTQLYVGNSHVFFRTGFENVTLWDWSSFPSVLDPGCAYLQNRGITHIVLFYPNSTNEGLGSFNNAVVRDAQNGLCGREVSGFGNWVRFYQFS